MCVFLQLLGQYQFDFYFYGGNPDRLDTQAVNRGGNRETVCSMCNCKMMSGEKAWLYYLNLCHRLTYGGREEERVREREKEQRSHMVQFLFFVSGVSAHLN